MLTCVREFFLSVIICPPSHTSRNLNFQSQPVGRSKSFWNGFVMSSTFGSVLLATIYWNLTYFHYVSRDPTATFRYFWNLTHLRSDRLRTSRMIRDPLISVSLLPSKRAIRTLLGGYVELGRLSKHTCSLLFEETIKLSGIFIHIVERWYLREHITAGCESIRNTSGILWFIRGSIRLHRFLNHCEIDVLDVQICDKDLLH
jgi:hypothetical protein